VYLAVDIGTSSLKAALCEGGSFWVEQLPLQLTQADPCAEQDPREWLEGLAVLLPRLLQRAGASPERIQAVGLSSHSPSLVPVDSHCRPLFPCLTWRDRRAVRQAEKLREQTGEFFDPSFFEPKMLWLKEERPEIYAQTRAFLQPKDFLIAWLTGEFVIDLPAARFSRAQAIGELESGKLPRPCPSWEVVGKTQKRAQELGLAPGIPVVAGGGPAPRGGLLYTTDAAARRPGVESCGGPRRLKKKNSKTTMIGMTTSQPMTTTRRHARCW